MYVRLKWIINKGKWTNRKKAELLSNFCDWNNQDVEMVAERVETVGLRRPPRAWRSPRLSLPPLRQPPPRCPSLPTSRPLPTAGKLKPMTHSSRPKTTMNLMKKKQSNRSKTLLLHAWFSFEAVVVLICFFSDSFYFIVTQVLWYGFRCRQQELTR